ncbi:hypothetical protein TNIN_60341 [Trichonephila inaurata madagascariensis]|uniref:Uncharacterized protein n=1 Tax=Trichonephila inaurata madagascariensis TaxID=2747483 RepID=A0A8X6YB26_9ARAC|nr:hypothetical protein TNIN_60341 [Trichonephila inaurata madagascariensis]
MRFVFAFLLVLALMSVACEAVPANNQQGQQKPQNQNQGQQKNNQGAQNAKNGQGNQNGPLTGKRNSSRMHSKWKHVSKTAPEFLRPFLILSIVMQSLLQRNQLCKPKK